LDEEKEIFKRCYYTCKRCNIRGNEASNNCIECIPNYTLYNNIMNISNCYPKCEYYYYFDESNNYNCNETCPGEYKLIINKTKCIDDCKNEDTYQFEYNNICYQECPKGSFQLEDNDYLCYDETPNGYFLDLNEQIYKKCYESCNERNKGGNETNNNCIEWGANYTFLNNSMNISNCYPICEYYYYFDESNKYHCNETCQGNYNKVVIDKKICIDDCKNDGNYQYEYNNTCYQECPKGSIHNETNLISYDIKNIDSTFILNDIINNTHIVEVYDERDKEIETFKEENSKF